MPIDFLPEQFDRATQTTIVVPVSGHADLGDPSTGRTLIPAHVEIFVKRIEGGPKARTFTYVSVTGPRRLKSGKAGKAITSFGWERARNDGRHGNVDRPDWLTAVLDEHMPLLPA
ncbi:hypothetical protein AB0D56_09850 [Streptomyces sp. NPDC048209]|uniref:hypothetical protein n=1 Tax=Streptomyces sp. NPDC048209 TaxID=3156689 RepID=UPI00342022A3